MHICMMQWHEHMVVQHTQLTAPRLDAQGMCLAASMHLRVPVAVHVAAGEEPHFT